MLVAYSLVATTTSNDRFDAVPLRAETRAEFRKLFAATEAFIVWRAWREYSSVSDSTNVGLLEFCHRFQRTYDEQHQACSNKGHYAVTDKNWRVAVLVNHSAA
jgi:hypothetical protein